MLYESKLKNLGLQFFAESGEGDSTGNDNSQLDNAHEDNKTTSEKTFTQEQVKALLSKEKKQGRRAVLRELGLDPEDSESVTKAKKTLEDFKTDAEKANDTIKLMTDSKNAAEQRAIIAERKLALIDNDCKKEFIDEVATLVASKMDDDTDFNAAIAIVKEKCPTFFQDKEEEKSNNTTGNSQGHKRQKASKEEKGSLGSRLAKGASKNTVKENPYFKN